MEKLDNSCPCGCGNLIEKTKAGYTPKYFSKECYYKIKAKEPNDSKQVIIHGVIYSTISEAVKQTNISRFLLLQKLFSPDTQYEFYPNHESQLSIEIDSLRKDNPLLVDFSYLYERKSKNNKMSDICADIGVKQDKLRLAYCLFDLDTSFEQITPHTKELLDNKEWLSEVIENMTTDAIGVKIRCSASSVQHACAFHGIKIPERFESTAEKEIADFVTDHGIEIIRRDKKTIGYEIDIFIPSLRIGIEYHGLYWHKEKRDLHYNKMMAAVKHGVRLIQIFEDEWIWKKSLVKSKIHNFISRDNVSIGARLCTVKQLNTKEVKEFFNKTHIQGFKSASFYNGLIYKGEIVAALAMNKNKVERFSTSANVPGAFGKLFSSYRKEHKYQEYITFVDLRWSHPLENIYTKNDFKFSHISAPNYFYVKQNIRESRVKYQKASLKKFSNYDISKSEHQIMTENRYYRVYDAGNAKLVWTTQHEQ